MLNILIPSNNYIKITKIQIISPSYNYLGCVLNMNQRSKSQKQIYHHLNKIYKDEHKKIEQLDLFKQQLQQKTEQNRILHRRINESTPILMTIYDKVKKKQQLYQQEIANKDQKYNRAKQLAKEYKQYSQEGLKLYKKDIINRFQSISNYSNSNPINSQNIIQKKSKSLFQNQQKKDSHNKVYNKLIQKFSNLNAQKPEQSNNQNTNKSIYERYKYKLEKGDKQNESVVNKVRRLSKEFDQDLYNLRLNKNTSLKNIKQQRITMVRVKQNTNKIHKGKKEYFLQLQKKKLKCL